MENEEIAEERIGASSDRVRGQPVRLVWMVNQIDHQLISDLAKDPVHIVWMVNQIDGQLTGSNIAKTPSTSRGR